MIEKPSNLVILTLLMTACAIGPSPTTPARSETRETPESTSAPADAPTADAIADEAANDDGARSDESDQTDEGESSESSDDPATEERVSKPGRIVLKTVYDDKRVGEDQHGAIEAVPLGQNPGEHRQRLLASVLLVGGNQDQARAWLHAHNHHLGGAPAELIRSVTGMVRVGEYLDALRGKS